jgi:preprotein translocase SecF subunit
MHFLANRKKFYLVSGTLVFLSFLAFFFVPKNYGIDMTWGLQVAYSADAPVSQEKLEEVRADILDGYMFESRDIISDILIYSVNTSDIRMDIGLTSEEDIKVAQMQVTDIRASLPEYFQKHDIVVSELSFVSVGNSFGKFVLDRAYLTLTMCLISIAIYLMFAFRKSIEGASSFSFGAITLGTLFYDIIVASGMFIALWTIFPVLKIDTFFVTAILTILGFSINDTIVILDRIRSNYKNKKSGDRRSTKQIFEESIQVSLRRSLYTSMTLIIVLICMLFFGPEALMGFTTLMLLGTITGTYSSICLAAPILYDINTAKKI